jgi:multiple sugar transport system substrate-binding protein
VTIAVFLLGCAREPSGTTLRFWAMGREGEVVQELVRDFEREHPEIRVVVQQIPWGAAHEKLLTAHVGRSTPDLAQLGNTWIAEFTALRAIEPLDARLRNSTAVPESAYFPGIWDTNVVEGVIYGVPWYVDTRVLFYRSDLLARAGYSTIPGSWAEWRRSMEAVKRVVGDERFAIFLPTNEYTPWIVLGLQAGSPLLTDRATRGVFAEPAYRRAVDFSLGLYEDRLAPAIQGAAIANLYQEFERGTFSMYITGPWNLGEFRRRLAPEMQSAWATAPLPGPGGPESGVSVAGGSSLVLFRASRHQEEAWKLIEFLSRPEQQARFYRLTGDLPARREAWRDSALAADPQARAFEVQLGRVVSTPKIPEWEQISMKLREKMELAILGRADRDSVMASLDREVDRILEKRRWLLARRGVALEAEAR